MGIICIMPNTIFYNVKSYISKIIDIGFPKKIIDIRFVHIYFVQNNLITLVIN